MSDIFYNSFSITLAIFTGIRQKKNVTEYSSSIFTFTLVWKIKIDEGYSNRDISDFSRFCYVFFNTTFGCLFPILEIKLTTSAFCEVFIFSISRCLPFSLSTLPSCDFSTTNSVSFCSFTSANYLFCNFSEKISPSLMKNNYL